MSNRCFLYIHSSGAYGYYCLFKNTIVGLEALTEYGRMVDPINNNLQVNITAGNFKHAFVINKDNSELLQSVDVKVSFMCGSRGVTGGLDPPPPLKNYKYIGILRNSSLDPLKMTKLSSQHSMLGHHWHVSETPFKWRFAGWQMMAHL